MRREFSQALEQRMEKDESIHLVTGDLGFGMFDSIEKRFPDRFHNVGSAEQLMMLTAIGLSLSGKKPITYTISPFYWRCAEQIRNYCMHEGVKVLMVGSGRHKDYAHDGFSHDATDIENLFSALKIGVMFPYEATDAILELDYYLEDGQRAPWFLNLKR